MICGCYSSVAQSILFWNEVTCLHPLQARRGLGSAVAFIATLSLDLAAPHILYQYSTWHVLLCAFGDRWSSSCPVLLFLLLAFHYHTGCAQTHALHAQICKPPADQQEGKRRANAYRCEHENRRRVAWVKKQRL